MSAAFDIATLRVARPCPKAWEDMAGDQRTRYCDHCRLNVYNLSELTTAEVEKLISVSEGGICGRLYRRADGTVLTKDCPVGTQVFRKRLARRAATIFAALLGFSSAAFAQHAAAGNECSKQIRITKSDKRTAQGSISGTVLDPTSAGISGARVTINDPITHEVYSVLTKDDGAFNFASLTASNYWLTIEASGFLPLKKQKVHLEKNSSMSIEVTLDLSGATTVGLLAVESPIDRPAGTMIFNADTISKLPH